MIVKRHSHYHPDIPESSTPSNVPLPASQPSEPGAAAPVSGEAAAPVVRAISPVTVKANDVGKPASDQAGLLVQHEALNDKINRLISQQPTYETFVKESLEYSADNPGAVNQRGTLFADTVARFWTSPRPGAIDSSSPQDQLINLHREMLSTQAALRVADGTLSAQSKGLIDKAFRYPTLASRERAFPDGSRVGVYPITVDDNTPNGARLAGAFMITASDGSQANKPNWPTADKSLLANERNGPVVLYTPGEGFEEFDSPAQLQGALMQRIDKGGTPAALLSQSLPLSAENLRKPLRGDDLTLSFSPTPGDVIAEAIPQQLARQKAELEALVRSDTSEMDGEHIAAMNSAANWTSQFDGSNAMLARAEKLDAAQQPQWLKNLSPADAAHYQFLDSFEEQTQQELVPLLEGIPSLQHFANQQINAALRQKYPSAHFDADTIVVSGIMQFSDSPYRSRMLNNVSITSSSLTDVALKNATAQPPAQSYSHAPTNMSAKLTDASGQPVLGADGKPIVLDTDAIKALVNELDVGGNYLKLLKERMAPDAVAGDPGNLRTAWKANLADVMQKQAFLGELNPQAYPQDSPVPEWVQAVLDFPDPATRPQVEGKTIVANTVSHNGQALQGVVAIGTAEEGPLALYSPDAPDGMSFRQVADRAALEALFEQPQWKAYANSKVSPLNPGGPNAAIQDRLGESIFNGLAREDSGHRRNGPAYLTPIPGNVQDALYKQLTELLIDTADVGSVSSAELAEEATFNKIMFGIEVASQLLDFVPAAGKVVSTALRFTKAGLRVLKAPGRAVVKVLNRPDRLALLYSRAGGTGGAAAGSRASPLLRPVLSTPPISRTVVPLAPAIPAGQVPSALSGVPDISAHCVPQSLLAGRTLRGDGTYQVGDQFYVRYTDGTGVSKPYEISPIYKIEGGHVRVIDPHTKTTVAFLQSAGGGEWRQSRLLGGIKRPTTWNIAGPSASAPKKHKLDEIFPGERALLQPAVVGENVYYHYTGKNASASINVDWHLKSSVKNEKGDPLPRGQGRHYFTDVAPTSSNQAVLSRAIFGPRRAGNVTDKITHFYKINTSGLTIMPTDNPHIFYVDTHHALPLNYPDGNSNPISRIIEKGKFPPQDKLKKGKSPSRTADRGRSQ